MCDTFRFPFQDPCTLVLFWRPSKILYSLKEQLHQFFLQMFWSLNVKVKSGIIFLFYHSFTIHFFYYCFWKSTSHIIFVIWLSYSVITLSCQNICYEEVSPFLTIWFIHLKPFITIDLRNSLYTDVDLRIYECIECHALHHHCQHHRSTECINHRGT